MAPSTWADSEIRVRAADASDGPEILRLERELAEFERLDGPSSEEGERLLSWIFAEKRFHALVAERGGKIVGIALYFFYPTSFRARLGLYLEDLVISETARAGGVGRALMGELARIAEREDCVRVEWAVLDWNERALAFYRRLGGRQHREWLRFSLEPAEIRALARG